MIKQKQQENMKYCKLIWEKDDSVPKLILMRETYVKKENAIEQVMLKSILCYGNEVLKVSIGESRVLIRENK